MIKLEVFSGCPTKKIFTIGLFVIISFGAAMLVVKSYDARTISLLVHGDYSVSTETETPTIGRNYFIQPNEESKTLEHWVPDWYNNSKSGEDIEAMLSKRRKEINKRCKQINRKKSLHKSGILQSETLSYCPTYKAGYTFWRSFLSKEKVKDKKLKPAPRKKKVSFTVTRNPWHRLVSCWHDRFTLPDRQRTGVMRQFCLGKSWPTLPPFSEFIEHCVIANWKLGITNVHWRPTVDHCKVCSSSNRFDYYFAQENMDAEVIYVFSKYAGLPYMEDHIKATHQNVSRQAKKDHFSDGYQDQYQNISTKNMEILKEIYKDEIYVFNYPQTPYVDFDKA